MWEIYEQGKRAGYGMTIEQFVESTFGKEKLSLLKNMRKGGDSNSKGVTFELFFAVAAISEISANENHLEDFEISAQELAFVDDLTIRRRSVKLKDNYQLKNSNGSSADWNDEMRKRFEDQYQIDIGYHRVINSRQFLVVSCQDKANSNDLKIPEDMKERSFSQFFPYRENSFELITETPSLKQHLSKICNSDDLQTLVTAFTLMLSVWVGSNTSQTVSNIMTEAKKRAKPDIFRVVAPIPEWLVQKVATFLGMKIRVEFGHFIVGYCGLDVTIGADFSAPDSATLAQLSTPHQFMRYLMDTILPELNNEA
jgi:hypothetical protein